MANYTNMVYPPGIKTPWLRHNDVCLYVPATYVPNEAPKTSRWNVAKTS